MSFGFECPKCGSSYFKTVSELTIKPWVRRCRGNWTGHGKNYSGCDYTWTSDRDAYHGLENHEDLQK